MGQVSILIYPIMAKENWSHGTDTATGVSGQGWEGQYRKITVSWAEPPRRYRVKNSIVTTEDDWPNPTHRVMAKPNASQRTSDQTISLGQEAWCQVRTDALWLHNTVKVEPWLSSLRSPCFHPLHTICDPTFICKLVSCVYVCVCLSLPLSLKFYEIMYHTGFTHFHIPGTMPGT